MADSSRLLISMVSSRSPLPASSSAALSKDSGERLGSSTVSKFGLLPPSTGALREATGPSVGEVSVSTWSCSFQMSSTKTDLPSLAASSMITSSAEKVDTLRFLFLGVGLAVEVVLELEFLEELPDLFLFLKPRLLLSWNSKLRSSSSLPGVSWKFGAGGRDRLLLVEASGG